MVRRVILCCVVPLVGPQEELRYPRWTDSQEVYFEPRAGGEVKIFGSHTNKKTNEQKDILPGVLLRAQASCTKPAVFQPIFSSHKYVSVEREKESGATTPDDGQLSRGDCSYRSGVSVLPYYQSQFVYFPVYFKC